MDTLFIVVVAIGVVGCCVGSYFVGRASAFNEARDRIKRGY